MPARDSNKVGDMFPKNSMQQALNLVLQCVGSVDNENLTAAQSELLLWHWKLGIGMQQIQAMMRDQLFEDHLVRYIVLRHLHYSHF